MGMPATRRRWTIAEVRALTREGRPWPRYELIGGELLVTPAPRGAHQYIVTELTVLLHAYLERWPIGHVLVSPADLELEPGTITQPDVFVVPTDTRIAGEVFEWSDVKRLLLAVEVLSASNVRTDRVVKRDFYLDHGVAEYWVVDVDARIVERWTASREAPVVERGLLKWTPGSVDAMVLDLDALFDSVARKIAMFGR